MYFRPLCCQLSVTNNESQLAPPSKIQQVTESRYLAQCRRPWPTLWWRRAVKRDLQEFRWSPAVRRSKFKVQP